MIKRIIWKRNDEIFTFFGKNQKLKNHLSKYKEISMEFDKKITYLLSMNELSNKPLNEKGKTLIFSSILYVLCNSNDKEDFLLNSINGIISRLIKNDEIEKNTDLKFIFSFDISLEFEYKNELCTIERRISLNEKDEKIKGTNKWFFKQGNFPEEELNKKYLIDIVIPMIFSSWPKRYGVEGITDKWSKKMTIPDFDNITPHDYFWIFFKPQTTSGVDAKASFFKNYKYWTSDKLEMIIYSIFCKNKNILFLTKELIKKANNINEKIDKNTNIKEKNNFINKMKKTTIRKDTRLNINFETIFEIEQNELKIMKLRESIISDLIITSNLDTKSFDNEKIGSIDVLMKKNLEFKTMVKIEEYKKLVDKNIKFFNSFSIPSSQEYLLKIMNDVFSEIEKEVEISTFSDTKILLNSKEEIKIFFESKDFWFMFFGGLSGTYLEKNEVEKISEFTSGLEVPILLNDGFNQSSEQEENYKELIENFEKMKDNFSQIILSSSDNNIYKSIDKNKASVIILDKLFFIEEIDNEKIKQKK